MIVPYELLAKEISPSEFHHFSAMHHDVHVVRGTNGSFDYSFLVGDTALL